MHADCNDVLMTMTADFDGDSGIVGESQGVLDNRGGGDEEDDDIDDFGHCDDDGDAEEDNVGGEGGGGGGHTQGDGLERLRGGGWSCTGVVYSNSRRSLHSMQLHDALEGDFPASDAHTGNLL